MVEGWRPATIDVDLRLEPGSDALMRRIVTAKSELDINDVAAMIGSELVDGHRLQELYDEVEPQMHRYPAIDAGAFRESVRRALSATLT